MGALALLSEDSHDSLFVTVALNLGVAHMVTGDAAKSLEFLERALAAQEKTLGAFSPELVGTLQNLTVVCSKMGDSAKAVSYMQRAGEIETHVKTEAQGVETEELQETK